MKLFFRLKKIELFSNNKKSFLFFLVGQKAFFGVVVSENLWEAAEFQFQNNQLQEKKLY